MSPSSNFCMPGSINKIPVPVPPLAEQRAIASLLMAFDRKVELNGQINETLEATARAIFKSWFVDFDPVRTKSEGRRPAGMDAETAATFPDSFTDSALGEIPDGWEVASIEQHVDFLTGFPFSSKMFAPKPPGFRLLRGANVAPGRANWADEVFWPIELEPRVKRCSLRAPKFIRDQQEFGAGRRKFSTKNRINLGALNEGDVVLAMDRPWIPAGLKILMLGPHDLPCLLVQRVARLRGIGSMPTSFLYALLRGKAFAQHVLGVQTGSTIPHVSGRDILSYRFVLPPTELLAAFEQLAGPVYSRMLQNAAESETLAALRDTLLPKLMSGELRIKDAEKLASAAL